MSSIDVARAATIHDVIHQIVASLKSRRLVVFCGAGISFNSGLPLASNLVKAVLDKLEIPDVSHKTFLPPHLPFEAFMETLRADSDEMKLLDLFKLGEPNNNHILLAKLAKRQLLHTVCTTNFDGLVEAAFEAEGLQMGSGYNVAFRDIEFDSISWMDPTDARVIKLHGSVADTESMAITLRQVSHQELSAHRQRVIENLFSTGEHEDVLVLGYSCSDVFDITPHIETLAEKRKRIFLVEHVSGDEEQVEDLSARSDRNPFHNFARSLRIRCNTDRLIVAIWQACLEEPYRLQKSSTGREAWQKFVDAWYQHLMIIPASRFALAGHLFARLSAWNQAATYFEQAESAARAAGDERNTASYLSSLGLARTHLGNYQAAIDCHRKAIEIAKRIGDRLTEATNTQNMANAYQAIGDLQLAMLLHRQAATIAVERGNAEGIAACYAAIGILASRMGQFEEAVRYLKDALAIATQDANLAEQAKISGSLGDAYLRAQNLAAAKESYLLSLDLSRKIGLKEAEGKVLGNIGLVYLLHHEYDDAVKCLEESRTIAQATDDPSGEGKCLGSLGLCHHSRGEYEKAIERYQGALHIARRIGDLEMTVNSCMSLSHVYGLTGDDATARQLLAEARNTARGNAQLEATVEQKAQAIAQLMANSEELVAGAVSSSATQDESVMIFSNDPFATLNHPFAAIFGPQLERCLVHRKLLWGLDIVYGVLVWAAVSYFSNHPDNIAARWSLLFLSAAGFVLSILCFWAVPRVARERQHVSEFAATYNVVTGRAWSVLILLLRVSGAAFFIVGASLAWFS